jgi:GDP-D-mannose dehydratase
VVRGSGIFAAGWGAQRAATYGVPDAVPIAEGAPTRPINPYGRSKLMTEWMLADVAAAHPLDLHAPRALLPRRLHTLALHAVCKPGSH